MKNEQKIQTLQRAKGNAVAFYHCCDESQDFWEQVIDDCDEDIIEIANRKPPEPMFTRKRLAVMLVITLILLAVALCGCATAKASLNLGGAVMQDTGWALKKMSENITVQEK